MLMHAKSAEQYENIHTILRILREQITLIQPWNSYPFTTLGAHVLDLSDGLGDGSSEDAVAVFGDEQVVFDADATEVLAGL